MNPPLGYRILKQYVRLGLSIYFRQWQNAETEYIPATGPVIFVGNHQNSFLDALLVVCGIRRNPWFLARGDVFRQDWAIRWLTFLQIMPVFRFRDGHSAMRRNEKVINDCLALLKKGECLLLFGEGTHNDPWTMSPLQRGFAQIALQYTEQYSEDIQIIPVAYHYELHEVFRSRVLVQYGRPISVKSVTNHVNDFREKLNILRAHVEEALRPMVLVLTKDEDYNARKEFLIHNRLQKETMLEQLQADRELVNDWRKSEIDLPVQRSGFRWFDPVYLYGRVAHAIPHWIMGYIIRHKIKDRQFISSVKLAVGIFLVPLYYILVAVGLYALSPDPLISTGILVSLPLSGLYAYNH